MKFEITPQKLTKMAVVAALYVALTWALPGLAYGPIQFRVSELLMLLCFFKKDYIVSLTVGCAVANLLSPLMLGLDLTLGVGATLLAAICMWKCRHIWVAALFPVIFNGLLVGLELNLALGEPLFFSMGTVALGELAAVLVVGVPVFLLMKRNRVLMRLIGDDKTPLLSRGNGAEPSAAV